MALRMDADMKDVVELAKSVTKTDEQITNHA